MNGLPPEVDLSPLQGREVIQLCFGLHDFEIRFDKDARIMVEGDSIFRRSGTRPKRIRKYWRFASELSVVLGYTVSTVSRRDDGGLLLQFSNRIELQLLNDSENYESFHLYLNGRSYVA